MQKYFISYDLRNSRNYKKLIDELEKFEAIQVLESLFCFKYEDDKTEELRDYFRKFIDADDGLIIIKSAFWTEINLNNSSFAWLEKQICNKCINYKVNYDLARSAIKFNDFSKKIIYAFKYSNQTAYAEIFANVIYRQFCKELSKCDLNHL